jgi:hypothetical protein
MHPIDIYISTQIKRFANRHAPPANGRLSLLRAASSGVLKSGPQPERYPFFRKNTYENRQAIDWSFCSADWSILNHFRLDALMMHHVL